MYDQFQTVVNQACDYTLLSFTLLINFFWSKSQGVGGGHLSSLPDICSYSYDPAEWFKNWNMSIVQWHILFLNTWVLKRASNA